MLVPASIVAKLRALGPDTIPKTIRDVSAKFPKHLVTVASVMTPQLAAAPVDILLVQIAGILTLVLWLAFSYFGFTKVLVSSEQSSDAFKASEQWMRIIRVDIVGFGPRFLLLFIGMLEIVLAQLFLTQYRNIGIYGLLFVMMNAVIVCHALGKPKMKAFFYFILLATLLIICKNADIQHLVNFEFKSLTFLFGDK